MRKTINGLLKCLSVFLAILFVIQIVPNRFYEAAGALIANAFAEEESPFETVGGSSEVSGEEGSPSEAAVILGELVEKRTADTKYYRMSDGTYQVLQYPQAVHYEAGGGWSEYDNTLQNADSQELKTTSSDIAVRISKKTNGRKFVSVEKDGYRLSWYYADAAKRTGEITYADEDGDPATLEKVTSEVRYNGIFQDVDLQYVLTGNTVKENVILNSKLALRTYTMEYQSTGLTPVQEDARTISLNNKAGETEFVIAAPYMEDGNRAVSEGVTLTLTEEKNGKFTLLMALDETWLDDPSRVYPVTVDPVLVTSQSWNDATNCESAYIASGMPNACYGRGGTDYEGSLHVGRAYDRGQCRALIKTPNLPELGVADKVVHAELALYTTECYPEVRVDLHRVTTAWNQSSVCWNSNIQYDSKIIDYQLIQTMEHADPGKTRWQRFEIMDLVRSWYSGEAANNGVLLRSEAETGTSHARAWFLSSGYPSTSAVRPVLQISYRNMSGYEDYWSYTNLSAGRSGIASVNNYNGNLVYSQPVTGDVGGNLMPVNLSLVYNANAGAAPYTYLGAHIQTNYHMYLRYDSVTASNGFKYYLNDADGTRHWFYFEGNSNSGKDEDGLGYTLDVMPSVSDSDVTSTKYTITDKNKNKMYFNGPGDLIKITNAAGISATVQYEISNQLRRIKTIKDGAGRTYTFEYNPKYWELCMSITDPGGRKTSFDYYQGTMCWITFPDSRSLELVYDYSRYVLTQIKAIDGTRVKIEYDSSAQKRVAAIDSGSGENVLERYTFAYKQNATTVTDKQDRSYTYQFNDFGQTTGVVSNTDGAAQFFTLEPGNSTSLKANKLLSESKVIKSVTNYLVNPGFSRSFGDGYGTYIENPTGTHSVSIDSSKYHFTKDSLRITKSQNNGGRVFALQDVTGIAVGRYTLSGYINTNSATLPGNGAYLGIELRNNTGTLVSVAHIEETVKTNGWERRSVTFDLPAGHSLRIIAGFEPTAYGSVWFDDLQLEKGTGESSFNLVENSTFLKDTSRWESENGKSVEWNYVSLSGYDHCAKVPGTIEEQYKNVIQNLAVPGKSGDVFSFGMWTAANSAPVKNGTKEDDAYRPRFEIILHYYDAITGIWKGCIKQECNPDLKGQWQFVTQKAVIPEDYSHIAIQLVYNHNVNNAYITGAFCYKEEYGQTYTYDDKGNIVSSVDLAKTQSKFSYYGNQMAKLLNPSGSRYLYAYNTKQQLTYALSSDGQQYGFTYDSKGNVTNATVTARKPAVTLESGKEYYIVNADTGLAIKSNQKGTGEDIGTNPYDPANSFFKWKLEAVNGETNVYRLKSVGFPDQNYYMDVYNASAADGTRITQYEGNGQKRQNFKIEKKKENTYAIFTGTTDYVKTIEPNNNEAEIGSYTLLQQKTCDRNEMQESMLWYFYPVERTESRELSTSASYTSSGNFAATTTDQRGNVTQYNYTENKGELNSVTDPLGRVTNYTYEGNMGKLTSVSSGGSTVNYSYDKDFLTEIYANNTVRYQFFYDQYGRGTDIKVGNGTTYRKLSGKMYNGAGLLSRQTYGNGDYIEYTYDNLDRLIREQYNGDSAQKVEYAYGSDGRLTQITDGIAGKRTKYVYDFAGRTVSVREYEGTDVSQNDLKSSVTYEYADQTNYLIGVKHFSELGTQAIGYRYGNGSQGEMPDQIYGVTWNGTEKQSYTYDGLGRLTNRQIHVSPSTMLNNTYSYVDVGEDKTTMLLKSMWNGADLYSYEYDAAGNITSIAGGGNVQSYEYDSLNRLVRENDQRAGKTYTYEYENGNIRKKKEYEYTTGTISGTPKKESEWSYANTEWGDLLTLWSGQPVEYDAIGNPTAYGYNGHNRREYTWTGRRLDAMSICHVTYTTNIVYGYNGAGERISRTITGENGQAITTRYIYNGGILAGQSWDDGKTLEFYYDNNGEYFGFRYNNAEYYYLRNGQNDVTGIVDSTGVVVVKYSYDAWGKQLSVTDGAGNPITNADHVGIINPIRYRGYYYETETGYYYLNSRYYLCVKTVPKPQKP